MVRALSIFAQGSLIAALVLQTAQAISFKQAPFSAQTLYPNVPVDLYVMSKCPDAVRCEDVFGRVLDKVSSIINLNVHYIGDEKDGQLVCKHGEAECRGNKMQLCAKALYRWHQIPSVWYRFIQCQNEEYQEIGTNESLEYCALIKDLSYKRLKDCADGQYGTRLLNQSFTESKKKGISTSCTIEINQKVRCIHDSTWKECDGGHEVEDFVRDICAAYKILSPRSVLPKDCPQEQA
ncbi:hypothetical protein K493DRAFT_202571 [Basidiobolus meristosporus CBS 931.73]|uniref:Gamma interferon inducible lysosomal thiol reductase n=1 Tax=Basidiobolus meristosporus CBS 931.73 TaxID=1314790 RepID=A0A1Y1Z9Z0_9FUNG|nr:hypothetical protein K493DRAFT_202571 [Basidiobolus meristosporus CBS 931.73]|eukprot:ORY07113.1 hypothetical protein K493DRAFT_202571 [Basidiobolus meristosporus CBS 931.73]